MSTPVQQPLDRAPHRSWTLPERKTTEKVIDERKGPERDGHLGVVHLAFPSNQKGAGGLQRLLEPGQPDSHPNRANQPDLGIVRAKQRQSGAAREKEQTAELIDGPELSARNQRHHQLDRPTNAGPLEIDAIRLAAVYVTPLKDTENGAAFIAVDGDQPVAGLEASGRRTPFVHRRHVGPA